MFDRTFSLVCYIVTLSAGCGAAILLLDEFVVWLQTSRWSPMTLLELGYELGMLNAQWFLGRQWSWPIHDALKIVPVFAALLVTVPPAWWLARRLAQR